MILALIDKLSDDIMREIFVHCLPENYWKTSLVPLEAPVLLTHICAHWRHLAHQHAKLWSSLHMKAEWTGYQDDVPRTEFKATMVQEAALRARLAPLSLRLDLGSIERFKGPLFKTVEGEPATSLRRSDVLGRIMVTVARSSRLTCLSLHLVYDSTLRNLPPDLFTSLERLTLDLEFNGQVLATTHPIRAFQDAPSLRRVALGPWDISWDTVTMQQKGHPLHHLLLPLHQLTHYLDSGADGWGSTFFPDFFEQCACIEYAAVKLDKKQAGPPVWLNAHRLPERPRFTRRVTSSTLKVLGLAFSIEPGNGGYRRSRFAYPEFMDFVEFPQLEGLVIDCGTLSFADTEKSWTANQKTRFLEKLSALDGLRYLSITCRIIDAPSLASLLRATPNVTKLDVHCLNVNTVLKVLNWDNPAYADLLPELNTLVLELGKTYELESEYEIHESVDSIKIDNNIFFQLIKTRIRQSNYDEDSDKRRLSRVVLHGRDQQRLDDHFLLRVFLQSFASRGWMEYEERLVEDGPPHGRASCQWLDRDPVLQDWPEVYMYSHSFSL